MKNDSSSNICSPIASTSDSSAGGSAVKRARRMVSNLEMEDDEEVTTSDEEEEDEREASADEDEEEEEDEPLPEALAVTRARRPNAGRKMAELMAQQINEKDDFYGTLYGGFEEAEQDEDFESPPHSSDEEGAEEDVDSDFDRDEDEGNDDAPVPTDQDPELIERRQKRLNQKRLLEHNKNWAIARINRAAVPENVCDPKTQRQRLEEAKQTAELNIASLKRFEDMELERRRRHQKPVKRRALDGPRVRELWASDGRHFITYVPEPPPADQCFPKPRPREFRICAISGQPARYTDPVTRLPYADIDAFRVLREKYRQFLEADREQQRLLQHQQQRKKSMI